MKLKSFFSSGSSCNITSRLLDDEGSHNTAEPPDNNQNYIFINKLNKINEEKYNIKETNKKCYNNLLSLDSELFYRIFSFIYDDYLNLLKINKQIKNKIKECLNQVNNSLIQKFIFNYESILLFKSTQYCSHVFISENYNRLFHSFDLIISCEIKSECKEYCSYKIVNNYKLLDSIKSNYISDVYQFDIKPINNCSSWLACEVENCKNNSLRTFTTRSNITCFCVGDIIQFKINLMSQNSIVDTKNFQWKQYEVYSNIPKTIFENDQIKKYYFDGNRHCEIEKKISVWKKISLNFFTDEDSLNTISKNGINDINKNKFLQSKNIIYDYIKYFQKYFKITSLYFGANGIIFYKIKMIAKKTLINNNKVNSFIGNSYFNFDIVDKKSKLVNRCNNSFMLNLNCNDERFQIREGSEIIFYAQINL